MKVDVVTRVEKIMLRGLKNFEPMSEKRVTKEIYCVNMERCTYQTSSQEDVLWSDW